MASAVGKFLLTLCKDNVYRLLYHIGYGNAAGFLFNFGLLGQYQVDLAAFHNVEKLPEGASSDEETIFQSQLDGINPITGQATTGPQGSDMTEDEKEAEATRLMGLFKRLEDTGVMKVITKKDE